MAVSTTSCSQAYVGNGVTTVFVVPFKFFSNADLVVKTTASGATQTKLLGADYSVSGAGSDTGGSVTFTTAPLSGVNISIARATPVIQASTLASQGPYLPKTVSDMADRLTLEQQEAQARLTALEAAIAAAQTSLGNLSTTAAIPHDDSYWVESYGAVGDGTADDTAAINAAIAAAQSSPSGGVVRLRAKVYRITSQLLAGARYVNESDVTWAVQQDNGIVGAPSFTFLASNAGKVKFISMVGEPGTVIWWNGANPVTETAMLYWGIVAGDWANNHVMEVAWITFAGPDQMTLGGNFVNVDDATPPSTNVTGMLAPLSPVRVRHCLFRGLKRGLVKTDCYFTHDSDVRAERCTDGYTHLSGNAAHASRITAYFASGNAFTLTGQGWGADHLWAEHCNNELFIPAADNAHIQDCYFEDTQARSNAAYGAQIGRNGAGVNVVWLLLENIHYDKHNARYFKFQSAHVTLINCRSFIYDGTSDGHVYSFSRIDDAVSYVTEIWSGLPWDPAGNLVSPHQQLGRQGVPDSATGSLLFRDAWNAQAAPAAGASILRSFGNRLQLSENGGAFRDFFKCGTVTIANAATSGAVVFGTAEADANYKILVTPSAMTGSPASGAFWYQTGSKLTTGFTLSLNTAPGGGTSVSYDWMIVR